MKINLRYLKQIGAFMLLSALVFSCAKFEEFTPIEVPAASENFTLESGVIWDSSLTFTAMNPVEGFVSIGVFEGTGNPIPDSLQLLRGNVSYLNFASSKLDANSPVELYLDGLVQDTEYELMMVSSNLDGGAVSSVKVLPFRTTDHWGPGLKGTDPAVSTTPELANDQVFVLTFDENVYLDENEDFIFSSYYLGMADVKGIATVSGNKVTVTPETELPSGDYIFLSYPGSKVTDRVGNDADTVNSRVVGTSLVGLYFRVAYEVQAANTVVPDVATAQAAGFDIVLTFDYDVRITGYTHGLTLSYETAEGTLVQVVPFEDMAVNGHELTIHQNYSGTIPYTSVTLDIEEFEGGTSKIVTVGARNPLAAASYTWNML